MLFWSRYFFLQWPTVLGTKSFTSSVLREVIFELPQTIGSPKRNSCHPQWMLFCDAQNLQKNRNNTIRKLDVAPITTLRLSMNMM